MSRQPRGPAPRFAPLPSGRKREGEGEGKRLGKLGKQEGARRGVGNSCDEAPRSQVLEPLTMAKILVVDDHPQIVRLLQRVLQTDAHEVIAASDGEEALQKVHQEGPALVILDVTMPKMNGYEVLRE